MASNIEVNVTSNLNTFESVRRFPSDVGIAELKEKLELLTGASANAMKIQLLDKNKQVLLDSLEDDKKLNAYQVENDMFLHVIDPTRLAGEFEDVSAVPKFEISEEEYGMRKDTFRAFKEQHMSKNKEAAEKKLEEEKKLIETFHISDRCEVRVAKQPKKRGTIRFIGTTDFKEGNWVGIEYDEPLGKNDGSFQGKRYFECQPKYGGFVRPQDVTIGDFPDETDMEL